MEKYDDFLLDTEYEYYDKNEEGYNLISILLIENYPIRVLQKNEN